MLAKFPCKSVLFKLIKIPTKASISTILQIYPPPSIIQCHLWKLCVCNRVAECVSSIQQCLPNNVTPFVHTKISVLVRIYNTNRARHKNIIHISLSLPFDSYSSGKQFRYTIGCIRKVCIEIGCSFYSYNKQNKLFLWHNIILF
jgi:hypothetical protein